MFFKKATKIDEIWHLLHNVKSTVNISSIFVAFLENMNKNGESFLIKIALDQVPTFWFRRLQEIQ